MSAFTVCRRKVLGGRGMSERPGNAKLYVLGARLGKERVQVSRRAVLIRETMDRSVWRVAKTQTPRGCMRKEGLCAKVGCEWL